MVNGLTDIVSQDSGHFQTVYEIWGFLQDGVVGHKISGSNLRVVGIQVYCCGIGCMATGGAKTKQQNR